MPDKKMTTRRVVLVDDEPAAISNLREVIDSFGALQVVAEITDGRTAITEIRRLAPDVVFLDIEMPEVGGFDVARATAGMDYQLVFVTAYDQYALDAFDTNAIDYLLKPVRPVLLEKCIRKILRQENVVVAALKKSTADHNQLTLSDSSGLRVLRHDDVAFIEGIGRYRRIHLTSQGQLAHSTDTILSDTTLDDFERQLTPRRFIRLHRGYIVRLGGIRRLLTESRRHFVQLDAVDEKIPVSRGKVAELKELLQETSASS
jgi:DNA-binding LytR/AlgR family response regulator